MILTVCLSPCTDVTIELDSLNVGKTNVIKNKTMTFGGKALNVAIGIARLGGNPFATGLMYNENGYLFESALDKEGVPCRFAWAKGRARENYKFIDNRAMLTEVNDVGAEVSKEKLEEILESIRTLSAKSEAVVLSGSLPRGVPPHFYQRMVEAVNPACKKIVDASGERLRYAVTAGVDLVKPNLDELENMLGRHITSKEDLLNACNELMDCGAKCVLVSLGKQGAVITNGEQNYYCKSINVAVNSTVGAGDGMVAAATMQLCNDAPLSEILRAGVAAGTATVMTAEGVSFTKEKYAEVIANLRVEEI